MRQITLRIRGKRSIICFCDAFRSLSRLARRLAHEGGIVLTDSNVHAIYGEQLSRALGEVPVFVMPAGEANKNEQTLLSLLSAMKEANLHRNSLLIAFGGGVVGDLGGLAAGLYMRGIDCIQVPTTLLAQVDSSVGGKTAIDFGGVKNLIGVFHQPVRVFIDPRFLNTLPEREIVCGLGEIVKYGALSGDIFDRLVACPNLHDAAFLASLVPACVAYKAAVVRRDPEERGERKCLNLGHTTGHAVELSLGTYSHGACVLIGMFYEARLSAKFCVDADFDYLSRLETLVRAAADFDPAAVDAASCAELARSDKKNTHRDAVTLIVPIRRGEWRLLELQTERYRAALAEI